MRIGRTEQLLLDYVKSNSNKQNCANSDLAKHLMESRGEGRLWKDARQRNNAENQVSRVMQGLKQKGLVEDKGMRTPRWQPKPDDPPPQASKDSKPDKPSGGGWGIFKKV